MAFLHLFLQIVLCFVWIYGACLLEKPWANIVLLTGGLAAIAYQFAAEYISYARKHYGLQVPTFWLWFLGAEKNKKNAPVRAMPKKYDLTAPEGSVLVQNRSGSIFQLIRCEHSLYFRKIWSDSPDYRGRMQTENLLTDYARLDNSKNIGKKDFRMNTGDLQHIACTMREIRWRSFRAAGVIQIRNKNKERQFYLLPECRETQLKQLFAGLPLTILKETYPPKPADAQKSERDGKQDTAQIFLHTLRSISGEQRSYLILRTVLYICLLMPYFPWFPYTVSRFWILCSLAAEAILLLYYLRSDKWVLVKKIGISGGVFSQNPSLQSSVLLASIVFLGYARENYLKWGRFLFIAGILTGILTLLLTLASPERKRERAMGKKKTEVFLLGLMIAGCFSGCLVTTVNVMYDTSQPIVYTAQVTRKYSRYYARGVTSCYVQAVTEQDKGYRVEVAATQYRELETGDTVMLYVYDGLLGIPYVILAESDING